MIKFGPSGNDELFYEQGGESCLDAPEFVKKMGLDVYEYSFSRGVEISDEYAKKFCKFAKDNAIEVSAHAPYYINFGSEDEIAMERSAGYVMTSLKKLHLLGGNRLVVHVGSTSKKPREDVLERIKNRLIFLKEYLKTLDFDDYTIHFEVMGKYSQIGSLEEILELTKLDDHYNICLDVGHLNCLLQGELNSQKAFDECFKKICDVLPPEKQKKLHIHFSKIMFNSKGEMKHLTLDDAGYDIDPKFMFNSLKKYKLEPWVVCESRGAMARDSVKLKNIFKTL